MPEITKLPRSTPEDQGVSSAAILDFVDRVQETGSGLHSFMLLRHGQVIAEGWWSPYAPENPHTLFSLTKSFTSTAVGLAVAGGLLSIEDPVLSFFPDEAPPQPSANLAAMRVRHLLSMVTGHTEDSSEKTVTGPDGNWVKGFFSMPVNHEPGAPFVYNSGASHVLSAIVQKVTGMPIAAYLQPRLFDPLGIAAPDWETDPLGINTGGWGLSLKTEDIARFGQLYLQKGIWGGNRILPSAWVEMAAAKQVNNDIDPEGALDWRQGYGFQFWRCRHNAYRGDGAFGQYCIVMPDQDAVLAITSGTGDMQTVLDLVWECILPAMDSKALPPDTDSQKILAKRLAGLYLDPPLGQNPTRRNGQQTYILEENSYGLEALQLEFTPDACRVTLTKVNTRYILDCGLDRWKFGSSSLAPNDWAMEDIIPLQSRPVAAGCAWTADDSLLIQACFYTTPFMYTLTCQFAGETVEVQAAVNVSFGPTELPSLVGRKDPKGLENL